MKLAFDSELTSLDLWHGGLPFSFQLCDDRGNVLFIEWDVDPFTRIPAIQLEDLIGFEEWLHDADSIVLHNAKIDIRAREAAYKYLGVAGLHGFEFPFDKVEDTLIKSHCLRNLWSHGLKDLRDELLHVPRTKQEALKQATNKARNICRSKQFIEKHGQWRIAGEGDPHWPGILKSPKEKDEEIEGWWLFDTWLPRAIWRLAPEFLPGLDTVNYLVSTYRHLHPWMTVLRDYAIEDVETTLVLNDIMDDGLEKEGLVAISQRRHKLIEISYNMESVGVTISVPTIKAEIARYKAEAIACSEYLTEQVQRKGIDNQFNPNSDKQLRELLYETWRLPVLNRTEPSTKFPIGQPKVDQDTLSKLVEVLEESNFAHMDPANIERAVTFIHKFLSGNRNEKAADTLDSYHRWSVAHGPKLGHRIHHNYNITGTKFTRGSTSNPNVQNVGTGRDVDDPTEDRKRDFLLRKVFGPRWVNGSPIEEWLSIDYQSIEYLIWGFSCKNKAVIDTYNSGLPLFKPIMEAVWGFWDKGDKKYKKSKNGIYSRIYGASEKHADKTFGRTGAVKLIEAGMPEIKPFTKALNRELELNGYITTLGGYRLYVEEDEPHKVVSAFVQGHAGFVIGEAMILCNEYLRHHAPDVSLLLQIHDELIFGGPVGFIAEHKDNLAACMVAAGEQFGIPTPTNRTFIATNWEDGEAL